MTLSMTSKNVWKKQNLHMKKSYIWTLSQMSIARFRQALAKLHAVASWPCVQLGSLDSP